MTILRANRIYSILVQYGGAIENWRGDFVRWCHEPDGTEWRFQGFLGFGGKFWINRNKVTCYPEDENPRRLEIIAHINEQLQSITDYENEMTLP